MADVELTRSRQRKTSRAPLLPGMLRWCVSCKKDLPQEVFNRDLKNKDGLNGRCRACHAAEKKAAYPRFASAIAVKHLRNTYGINEETYKAMVAAQDNRCAICRNDMGQGRSRHLDHCHATGKVRALLCTSCNVTLGRVKDDPSLLRRMADYIENYRVVGGNADYRTEL